MLVSGHLIMYNDHLFMPSNTFSAIKQSITRDFIVFLCLLVMMLGFKV
jgi:hypothetical protein